MAFNVASTLGNFLRKDREDFQPTREGAAEFRNASEATYWIEENYGPNGFKVFHPVPARRADSGGERQGFEDE